MTPRAMKKMIEEMKSFVSYGPYGSSDYHVCKPINEWRRTLERAVKAAEKKKAKPKK